MAVDEALELTLTVVLKHTDHLSTKKRSSRVRILLRMSRIIRSRNPTPAPTSAHAQASPGRRSSTAKSTTSCRRSSRCSCPVSLPTSKTHLFFPSIWPVPDLTASLFVDSCTFSFLCPAGAASFGTKISLRVTGCDGETACGTRPSWVVAGVRGLVVHVENRAVSTRCRGMENPRCVFSIFGREKVRKRRGLQEGGTNLV